MTLCGGLPRDLDKVFGNLKIVQNCWNKGCVGSAVERGSAVGDVADLREQHEWCTCESPANSQASFTLYLAEVGRMDWRGSTEG